MGKQYPHKPIYLVDDEEHFLQAAEMLLLANGITNVRCIARPSELLPALEREEASAILMDINMPEINGLELLPMVIEVHPETAVVMLSAVDDVATAVGCIRGGALNYLLKPIEEPQFLAEVSRIIDEFERRCESQRVVEKMLSAEYENPFFERIITENPKMRAIFSYIEAVAISPQPVLISGETGTGKEMIAEAVHACSGRPGSFVTCNVAGLDDTLFSDTLFGHVKGAFTGAEGNRRGLIEEAAAGTLFLDEIGDLSLASQIKLLRLLQQQEYHPLGADKPLKSSARIVVATNLDINQMQKDKSFRTDLYFRLKTHRIDLPPLRERRGDIEVLSDYFIQKSATILGKAVPTVPKELYSLLRSYSFPGNIRELESMVFDAVSRHRDHIMGLESFRNQMDMGDGEVDAASGSGVEALVSESSFPTLKGATRFLIEEAMRRCEGNQSQAAKLLGISRQALNQRLKTVDEG